jgi:hypothetical protein
MPINKGAKVDGNKNGGFLLGPGEYSVTIYQLLDGEVSAVTASQSFNVKQLYKSTLPAKNNSIKDGFLSRYMEVVRRKELFMYDYSQAKKNASSLELAIKRTPKSIGLLENEMADLRKELRNMELALYGNPLKSEVGEKNNTSLDERIWAAAGSLWGSAYGPTTTAEQSLAVASAELSEYEKKMAVIQLKVQSIYSELKTAGAPPIKGME